MKHNPYLPLRCAVAAFCAVLLTGATNTYHIQALSVAAEMDGQMIRGFHAAHDQSNNVGVMAFCDLQTGELGLAANFGFFPVGQEVRAYIADPHGDRLWLDPQPLIAEDNQSGMHSPLIEHDDPTALRAMQMAFTNGAHIGNGAVLIVNGMTSGANHTALMELEKCHEDGEPLPLTETYEELDEDFEL